MWCEVNLYQVVIMVGKSLFEKTRGKGSKS